MANNEVIKQSEKQSEKEFSPRSETKSTMLTANPRLSRLAFFHDAQVTGVTISQDGRLFACFPRWREGVLHSVVEINADGTSHPYPDESWNKWEGEPQPNQFTCIQSVVAHGDSLFVLDPANPQMKGVVGQAQLFEFDLKTNKLKRQWAFDSVVAPEKSYLNDLRIDDVNQAIYMTESGIGALVILDLKTGLARRVLDKEKSTRAEMRLLIIKGKPFLKNFLPARMHSDGIALHDGYLYFHALTGYHLYRVPTARLSDANLSSEALSASVEDLGKTPAPDGMIFDKSGNLYMADLEKGAIVCRAPSGEISTLFQDEALDWADTFTISADNELIFSDSHLMKAPPGKSADGETFEIYKIDLKEMVRH